MNAKSSDTLIRSGMFIRGSVRNGHHVDVQGYIEGDITAQSLVIHEGGRVFGLVRADNADIRGELQGEAFIKNLITIRGTGVVAGTVQYGQIQMESGGELSANLRNVPPQLSGDLNLLVRKGRAVAITTHDLTAFDPDDHARSLHFRVSNPVNGWIQINGAAVPASEFTQADLEAGAVAFVHDGSDNMRASFEVVVADAQGATSGAARVVDVAVTPT